MERALITGAAGFIGSHLAAELLRRGWAVTGLDARSPASDPVATENLAELTGDPRFQFVAGDVTGGDLAMVCEGVRACLLAGRLPQARIIAIDLSAALLTTVRNRLPAAARAGAARADFHRLPIRDGARDLSVAAFCLYHSRSPGQVIGEIARCLAQGATAVIAVKSEDSYRELDLLMAASGLDPHAPGRPSLYETAHSGNIEHLAAASLDVRQVVHDTHAFTFPALADLAEYLATHPSTS